MFNVEMFVLQHKNLLILYDAIGTLADSVGHHLNKPVSTPIRMMIYSVNLISIDSIVVSFIFFTCC